MGIIEIPTLTAVEQVNLDKEYEEVSKTVTIKFGEHDVITYELTRSWGGYYYIDDSEQYRTPEEFIAYKLGKMFKFLDALDKQR